MRPITTLLLGLAFAVPAFAQSDGTADAGDTPDVEGDTEADTEIDYSMVVYDDMFARWDGTRWFIATEVTMPWEVKLQAQVNHEFRTTQYQIRTIIACEKDWRRSRRRFEVDCTIEDFGMQATARDSDNPERVQQILDEIDVALSDAYLQLSVRDDGRVVGIDLEGPTKRNNREDNIHETLRLLMSRVVVGYNMKLRKFKNLSDGVWVEYNSSLMSIPTLDATSRGTSTLIHKLDEIDGNAVVESRGRGLIATGDEFTENSYVNYFETEFSGVSVYDRREGFMTERVWTLVGTPTASSTVASFTRGLPYRHIGRLRILDDDTEIPEVGPTRQVSRPGQEHVLLPAWLPLE